MYSCRNPSLPSCLYWATWTNSCASSRRFFAQSRRTMTPYPAVRPSYPLSEVKAEVSGDPPSRCDRHDRYQFPSSRREGCFRDSEKRFGFRSLYVSSRGGFDLATAALYLLEIRSNSAEFGSSINGIRQESSMALGLRRPLNGTK